MKLKTVGCVALMAISTAAIAQTTRAPRGSTMNNMSGMNSTMPTGPSTGMNTSDETMMNDMSAPNGTMAPNSSMPPR